MWDIYALRSSTGGYPWTIDGKSSTFVYIKNAADHAQQYFLDVKYNGGVYAIGNKTIGAGQTVTYDLRELRDDQIRDNRGRLIPLNVNSGQVHWSKVGGEAGVLIGRSEQVDVALGISSNYACINCCGDNPDQSSFQVVPGSWTAFVNDSVYFTATVQYQDCYGGTSPPTDVYDAEWTSDNLEVADVGAGVALAQAPGTAHIKARWQTQRYYSTGDGGGGGLDGGGGGGGSCNSFNVTYDATPATFTVKPSVASIKASITSTKNAVTGDRPAEGTFTSTNTSTAFATTSTSSTDLMVVFQTSEALVTITAQGVNPSESQLRWKIDRDPSDTVAQGIPGLSDQTGASITVTPSVAGNFRLICYYDTNGNSAYDSGEELRVLRLAVVRATLDANESTIDSPGVAFAGSQNRVTTFLAMTVTCVVLLEGGGSNRLIGVNQVTVGQVGNLTSENFIVNYPVPTPTPAPPGDVAGTEWEVPGAGTPMIDTGRVDSGHEPTGGDTAFRNSSRSSSTNPSGVGRRVTALTDDDPSFGVWDFLHPSTHNPWLTTQGGYSFREFVVAYSATFTRYYVVLAKGSWTITATGSNSGGGTWSNNGSSVTISGGNGTAQLTSTLTNGSPQSGDAAGVQVLGLSFANEHRFSHTP